MDIGMDELNRRRTLDPFKEGEGLFRVTCESGHRNDVQAISMIAFSRHVPTRWTCLQCARPLFMQAHWLQFIEEGGHKYQGHDVKDIGVFLDCQASAKGCGARHLVIGATGKLVLMGSDGYTRTVPPPEFDADDPVLRP